MLFLSKLAWKPASLPLRGGLRATAAKVKTATEKLTNEMYAMDVRDGWMDGWMDGCVKIHVYIQYGDTTGVQYYMLQGPWVKRLRQLPREQKVLSDNTITACTSRVDFYMVAEQTILVRQSR